MEQSTIENYQIQYKRNDDDKWRFWPLDSYPEVTKEMKQRLSRLRRLMPDDEFRVVKVRNILTIEVEGEST